MKKFKRFAAVLCTALIALTLTACGGGKSKDVTVDTAKLADELLTTVTSDELSKMSVDPSTVYLYQSDDVTSAIAYASSGATACEVAVIESKDAANAESMEKLLQDRSTARKRSTLPTMPLPPESSMTLSSRAPENTPSCVSATIPIKQMKS